jgi:two-component system, NarL family, sensor histidine kinase UhpB
MDVESKGEGMAVVSGVFDERLVDAVETHVKKQLARELHDDVAQSLSSLLIELENVKAGQVGRLAVQTQLTLVQHSIREVLNDIRELLYGLRGESVAESDLPGLLRNQIASVARRAPGVAVRVVVRSTWPRTVMADAAWNISRVVQEAVNNALLHAGARTVTVRLEVDEGRQALVSVIDDGKGPGAVEGKAKRFGIVGMRERAVLIGGDLSVEPGARRGTRVQLTVPLECIA